MHRDIRNWVRFQRERPETAARITQLVLSARELIHDEEPEQQIALLESEACKELQKLLHEISAALELEDDSRARTQWVVTVAYYIVTQAEAERR